jgi:hypothetical protein
VKFTSIRDILTDNQVKDSDITIVKAQNNIDVIITVKSPFGTRALYFEVKTFTEEPESIVADLRETAAWYHGGIIPKRQNSLERLRDFAPVSQAVVIIALVILGISILSKAGRW